MTTATNGTRHAGLQVATGAHWASLDDRAHHGFDVGAGYIYQRLPSEASAVLASSAGDEMEAESDSALDLHAGYLAFDHNIYARRNWRTWAGARGELWFHPSGDKLPGASVRLGVELYAGASEAGPVSDRCAAGVGIAHGTTAVGLFIDAGARRMPGGETATTASAGISVRLPSLAIFGVAIPGCQ